MAQVESANITYGYLVMGMKSWDNFEPEQGPFAGLLKNVKVKGEGMGYCAVYATMEEATEAAKGYTITKVILSMFDSAGAG